MKTKFSDMKDEKLQSIAQDCQDSINSECFGSIDYKNLSGSVKELERRKYKVTGARKLKFTKKERA